MIISTDNKYYKAIADAIREKTSSEDTFLPSEMAEKILGISVGGSSGIINNNNLLSCSMKINKPFSTSAELQETYKINTPISLLPKLKDTFVINDEEYISLASEVQEEDIN